MNNNLDPHNNLLLLLLVFFILSNYSIIPSQCKKPTRYSCGAKKATYEFSNTIDNQLSTLVKLTYISGSTKTTSNYNNGNPLFALAQCRGDVPNHICSTCISNAINVLSSPEYCKSQSDAQIWYNYCYLRYSNISFFGDIRSLSEFIIANINEVKADFSRDFNMKLTALMDEITLEAITSQNWIGKGTRVLSNNDTLYALLQCNKDLEYDRCNQCLTIAKTKLDYNKDCYNREHINSTDD
ncbi:hypothetical protein CASFOL_005675 [Castilleja foliolosa]|uniref:Gnk2-homologous domain-containing protein n=1 Tax=Castilleja foliolosa TaxID=1961234 RepID=A0ABD3E4P7_9LAMI